MLALHLDIPALKSLGPGVLLSFYPSMSQSDEENICFFQKKINLPIKILTFVPLPLRSKINLISSKINPEISTTSF